MTIFLLVTIYLCSNFYSNNVLEIHTNIANSIYLDSVVVVPAQMNILRDSKKHTNPQVT